MIIDEIHLIKNKTSKRYSRFLKWPCAVRPGLSGTPIQNDLQEFLSLAALLRPGQKMPVVNLSLVRAAREPNATSDKISNAEKQLSCLQDFTEEFTLQRGADSTALPKKVTSLVFLPLPDHMVAEYREALAQMARAKKPSTSIEVLEKLSKILYSTPDGNPKSLNLRYWSGNGIQTIWGVRDIMRKTAIRGKISTYIGYPKP